MRPDDRADRIKTLRDLWSEMMQNHTDIQRLWKASKPGQVLATGIEAPPPEEEESSCDESKCFGCGDLPPTTLTMELVYNSGTAEPWFDLWLGTSTFTYLGFYNFFPTVRYHLWVSDECRQYPVLGSYPSISEKYARYVIACRACESLRFTAGELNQVWSTEGDCLATPTISSPLDISFRYSKISFSCDPIMFEGTSGTVSDYTVTITE